MKRVFFLLVFLLFAAQVSAQKIPFKPGVYNNIEELRKNEPSSPMEAEVEIKFLKKPKLSYYQPLLKQSTNTFENFIFKNSVLAYSKNDTLFVNNSILFEKAIPGFSYVMLYGRFLLFTVQANIFTDGSYHYNIPYIMLMNQQMMMNNMRGFQFRGPSVEDYLFYEAEYENEDEPIFKGRVPFCWIF